MGSMDAPGTKSPRPLSGPTRRVEDERRGPLVSVLIFEQPVNRIGEDTHHKSISTALSASIRTCAGYLRRVTRDETAGAAG